MGITRFFSVILFVNLIIFQGYSKDLPFNGYVEYGVGSRIVNNDLKKDDVLYNEARIQIEFSKYSDIAQFNFKADFIHDKYLEETEIEVREANITLFPSEKWEMKIGRQVLTWGTGDLVFINDLFPKNWKSFFIGRNDEYLKEPVDAIKTSFFFDMGNLDIVIVPVFSNDEYITGERFTYWNGTQIAGTEFKDIKPDKKMENAEYYFRWSKNIKANEFALYFYKGFFKRPLGFDTVNNKGIFPELSVYGFSFRRQLFGGILNLEAGYYDSMEDRDGTDPYKENSIIKSLLGFEKELFKNFTAGIQYFSEFMQDYDKYVNSVGGNSNALKEENHDWITLRLTFNAKQQTLIYSMFTYYSPSERDFYIKPKIKYKMSDQIALVAGLNIFTGKNDYTFFGQLEDNTNAYFSLRYSY